MLSSRSEEVVFEAEMTVGEEAACRGKEQEGKGPGVGMSLGCCRNKETRVAGVT